MAFETPVSSLAERTTTQGRDPFLPPNPGGIKGNLGCLESTIYSGPAWLSSPGSPLTQTCLLVKGNGRATCSFHTCSLPSHLLYPQTHAMKKRGQDSPFSPASCLRAHTRPCSPAPCPIRRPAVSEGENPGSSVPGVVGTLPTSCPGFREHHGQEAYSLRAQFLLFMERACAFPAGR